MHFVVLSYPRTGSTVIQRLINTDPNSICVGEKPMAINHLYDFYASVEESKFYTSDLFNDISTSDDRNPLFNIYKVDMVNLRIRIADLYENEILCASGFENVGWKENFISPHLDGEVADQQIYFIRKLFPDIRFILNIRDPRQCANSQIWKVREGAIEEIQTRMNWMLSGFETGLFGENAIVTNYDDWSNHSYVLLEQLRNFGFDLNYNKCLEVLHEQLMHLTNIMPS